MRVSSAARIGWALAVLTAWTFGVRFTGLGFGVPCLKEADTFIAEHVRMLREGDVRFDRGLSILQYPSFLAHVTAPLSDAVVAPRGGERTLEDHLASAAAVWTDVRRVVALFSILIVPGTYLLARRFVSRGWALFAAALSSFSLLHVCFAQQARCHGVVASLALLAIVSILWMRRRPGPASYLATALAVAASVGCFHNGIGVLAPFAVAAALIAARKFRQCAWRWSDILLLATPLAAAASFRAFYWYYFDDEAQAAMRGEDATQSVLRDLPFDGSGFARLGRTLWYYEPLLAVLGVAAAAALGAAFLRRRGRRVGAGAIESSDVLVVLAYVLPYTLLAGLFDQTYERFLLPLVPHLAVFAAWGLAGLTARIGSPAALRAFVGACVAALALPAFASTKLAWLRAGPTTLGLTAQWIRDNVRDPASESVWVLPPLDFPLFRTDESLRYPPGKSAPFSPWSRYQRQMKDVDKVPPLYRLYWLDPKPEFGKLETDAEIDAYLRSFGPGLFVVESIDSRRNPTRHAVVQRVRALGERLARFSPDGDADFTDLPLWEQDIEDPAWPNVFWRVLRARAVGPVIEVHRLP